MKRLWILPSTLALAALSALPLTACDMLEPADDGATTEPTTATNTNDATTDSDTTPDLPTGPAEVLGFGAVPIPNGGDTSPVVLGGVPPFSQGSTDLTFYNVSDAPLTLAAVELEVLPPAEAFEFALTQPGRTERLPVATQDLALAPNQGLSFGLHFIPLASGPRDVKVHFKTTSGLDYVVTVHARGRDNASFSPNVSTALERILGRSNELHANGLELGGLAADAQGNLYFSGNGTEWSDGFNANLVLGKVTPTGALAWAYEWNEPFEQAQADIGNNGDTGGPADSIDVDAKGDVYATGYRVSCAKTGGSPETAFVVSLGASGSVRWARSLSNGGQSDAPSLARQFLRGYTVDATLPDRVLVAGRVSASGGFLLAALSKADGATLWAHDIAFGGGESRVGALVVDPTSGAAYVGGIQGAVPFMARVDGVDGAAPTLGWARNFQYNATAIHGAVLDGNGLLVALENRGLSTMFLAARIATVDGSVVWSKIWDATNAGDTNASLTIAKHDGMAVFGGRIAINGFDTQGGDGFLLGLDPTRGDYLFGALHYGGKGAEEMAHDYVVALVDTPSGLWALHQQTPGSNNQHHFWGRWYEAPDFTLELPGGTGAARLVDGGLDGLDATADTELFPLSDELQNWDTAASECGDGAWVDWTARFDVREPIEAESAGYRTGTHGLLQKLTLRK